MQATRVSIVIDLTGEEALEWTETVVAAAAAGGGEPRRPECVVCLNAAPVVKLSGCLHVCLCADCAKRMPKGKKQCPLCRAPYRTWKALLIG